jgi:hypothetical protein
MPPIEEATSPRDKPVALTCPLCGAALDPEQPKACRKCDWVAKSEQHDVRPHHNSFRDRAAVALSIIPGLGHIYKGYKMTGAIYMLGAVFAFMACFVAATFTAGFGMLLLPVYWAGVMLQVYWLEDKGITPMPKKT